MLLSVHTLNLITETLEAVGMYIFMKSYRYANAAMTAVNQQNRSKRYNKVLFIRGKDDPNKSYKIVIAFGFNFLLKSNHSSPREQR